MGILSELAGGGGRNALVSIQDGKVTNFWGDFSDSSYISRTVQRNQEADWYFALASYAPKTSKLTARFGRRASNAVSLRSLWLDIDAGEAKQRKHGDAVYADTAAALVGLQDALQASELLLPTHLIASGFGLHVYWGFNQDVPPDIWGKMAGCLGATLASHGLRIDNTRTQDPASILRVPGTLHQHAQRPVDVLKRRDVYPLVTLLESLSTAKNRTPPSARTTASGAGRPTAARATPTRKQQAEGAVGATSAFKQLANKHLTAARMSASATHSRLPPPPDTPKNRERVLTLLDTVTSDCSYEEWRNVIWAVQSLTDTGWDRVWVASALHEWSEKHAPDENWERAFASVWRSDERTTAARRIAIGSLVKQAVEKDPSLDGFHFASTEDADGEREAPLKSETGAVAYFRPAMPKFFFHHKDKPGLFYKQRLETENGVEIVTRHLLRDDTYVTDRIENADGTVLVYICTQEADGRPVKRIQVPGDILFGEWRDFRKLVTAHGVWPVDVFRGHGEIIMKYFQAQAEELKIAREATPTVTSYGWRERVPGDPLMDFAHGNTMYHPDGSTDVMIPDKSLHLYANEVVAHGDVDAWRVLPELYNHPGLEFAQLPVLLSIGAPLYRFTNCVGGVCMLHSEEGAAGKTSTLRVAGSVWSNSKPGTAYIGGRSTPNAMFLKMGMMGSLPCMFDEQTQQGGRGDGVGNLRDFILRGSGAVDKARMTAGGNTFRETPRWTTFALMTANTSIRTVCSGYGTSHAEIRRGLDVLFPSLAAATGAYYSGDHAFNAMSQILPANYGVAGAVLAGFYVTHQERMRLLVMDKINLLGADFDPQQRAAMSFPIAMCAVALAARDIAAELALVDYDARAFLQYCRVLLARQDEAVSASETSAEEVLNEYLRNQGDHIFAVRQARTGAWVMSVRPRAPFAGRWDTTHGKLYVSVESMRAFCVERSIDVQKLEAWLARRKALLGRERINFAEGMAEFATGRIYCYVIDARKARLPAPEVNEEEAQ